MNSGWELVLYGTLLWFSSAKCGQLHTLENLQSQIHLQQSFLFPHPLMYSQPQHYQTLSAGTWISGIPNEWDINHFSPDTILKVFFSLAFFLNSLCCLS